MIDRLLLFGATGDLAARFLLPALAELSRTGALPTGFTLVGAAPEAWDDERFRQHAAENLTRYAPDVPQDARDRLLRALSYRPTDVTDARAVADVVSEHAHPAAAPQGAPVAAYLALPTGLMPPAVRALGAAGLPRGSRLVLEKPFGEGLESAVALNALLAQVVQDAGEHAVFRVDHVLGMATVQDMLGLRLSGGALQGVWNGAAVEQVDLLWEETLALEGRAGFYDRAGALKDVLQNHLVQLLALVALEPPASLDEADLRDSKVAALRSVRPLTPQEVPRRAQRARYTAGRLSGTGGAGDRAVPSYADEQGVDAARGTETFAEVLLELDDPRWAGTRFRLRAGKALGARRKGVLLHLRPVPGESTAGTGGTPEQLWIGVDGPFDTSLSLPGSAATVPAPPAPAASSGPPPNAELPAYAAVLLDVLSGGSALSVRGDEAEQAWRILTPVLEAWADDRVPLREYTAGSDGPPPLELGPTPL